jgi:hypothetical protein
MIKLRRITVNLLLALMIATPLANSAAIFTEDIVDTDAARSKIPRNTRVFLPPEVAEVMKLSRAGVGEDVMLSYIQKSPADYMLSASQIVYLRDLGVSDSVIKAMVDHRATPGASTAQSAASANVNSPPAPAQIFIPAAPPLAATVNNQTFFQFLSPYGKWLDVPGSGWSWQPSVAVLDSKWQPYANNGNWVWSDMGWYWNSGYSWGWAPFHYGRWSRDTRLGWLWHPDLTWAPAWVSWRQSSQYVGWAPLPPGSAFVPGTGWIQNGTVVGARYAFGLVATDFEFVPYNQLLNRNWQDYKISASMLNNVFAQTSATNNFMVSSSGRIINVGVSPLRLQLASGSAWRQVTVIDREAGAAPSINVSGFTEATPASVSYPQTSSGMTPIYIVGNSDIGTSDTTTTTAASGTTGSGATTTSTDTTGAGSTATQNGLSAAAQSTTAGTATALATGSSGTTTANSVTTSGQNQNSYSAVTATPWLAASSTASSAFSPVVQTTAARQNTTANSLALATSTTSQSSSAASAASRSPYGPVNASSAGAVSLATTAASRSPYGPVNQSSATAGNSGNQALVTSATSTSSRSLNPFAPVQQTSTTTASGNQALVQASSSGLSATTTSSAGSASPVAAVNSPLAQSVPQVQTVTSGSIFNSGSTFPSLPGAPTLPAATTLPGAPTSISVSPLSTALRASGAAVSAARSTLSLRR